MTASYASMNMFQVCCKASNRVNALARVSRALDSVTKLTLMKSFISCYFNYCPLLWHFCGNECSKALQHIQFRALKFVYNDFKSSYTELLAVSGTCMSSFHQERIRLLATEMYKLYYKQGPTYLVSTQFDHEKMLYSSEEWKGCRATTV